MTEENAARVVQAYKYAIMACQDGISDLLEEVILDEMGKVGDESLEPLWTVTCGPDVVPLGAKTECTGIDHMSEEAKV